MPETNTSAELSAEISDIVAFLGVQATQRGTNVEGVIKSKRNFGIELETFGTLRNINTVRNCFNSELTIHRDASIRPSGRQIGCEFVSPILSGRNGETWIQELTKLLNEKNIHTNSSCGFHVHVDATDMIPCVDISVVKDFPTFGRDNSYYLVILKEQKEVMAQLIKTLSGIEEKVPITEIKHLVESSGFLQRGTVHYNLSELSIWIVGGEKLSIGKRNNLSFTDDVHKMYQIKPTTTIRHLLALNNLYSVYDSVFVGITDSSRRDNRYCGHVMPISLEKLSDTNVFLGTVLISQLLEFNFSGSKSGSIWEREGERYRGLNLQALTKHGTVEFRYHQGTINCENIIDWCALHLALVDYVKKNLNNYSTLAETIGQKLTSTTIKARTLFKLIDLDDAVQKRLLKRLKNNSRKHDIQFLKAVPKIIL